MSGTDESLTEVPLDGIKATARDRSSSQPGIIESVAYLSTDKAL